MQTKFTFRAASVAAFFFLASCSVPEDQLWKNRVAANTPLAPETTYVEALDIDVGLIMDSLSEDSLSHTGMRDFALYLPESGLGELDSNDWLEDSIIPRQRMQHLEMRLLGYFEKQPYNLFLNTLPTHDWQAKQKQLLSSILFKAKNRFNGPNLLDTLIPQVLEPADTSVAKIPMAAFVMQNDGDYVWVILTKWGEKEQTYEHIEGTIFDARSRKLIGKFFCN